MNKWQIIAKLYGQAMADRMIANGETGWTADRLADETPATPAILARHKLPDGTTESAAFFKWFANFSPRTAALAVRS